MFISLCFGCRCSAEAFEASGLGSAKYVTQTPRVALGMRCGFDLLFNGQEHLLDPTFHTGFDLSDSLFFASSASTIRDHFGAILLSWYFTFGCIFVAFQSVSLGAII